MISLKISGRAGNQFFQYAFVKLYMDKYNIKETLNISFEHLEKHKTDNNTFKNILNDFNTDEFNIIEKVKLTKKQKIIDIIYKIINKMIIFKAKIQKRSLRKKDYIFIVKKLQKIMNKNGLYYYIPEMKDFYTSKNKNIIFYGSFENSKYYNEYKDKIRKIYTPKNNKIEKNEELYRIIENNESVCVTIRRGDFLKPEFEKKFYICDSEYFIKGINRMNKLIKNPKYIVFSDDIEWCKNNIKFPEGTMFESGKDPIWEKIRLMYSCKHFIISNSTFSWWAQFLSENREKIVIAPEKWNNFEYCDLIYDNKWNII